MYQSSDLNLHPLRPARANNLLQSRATLWLIMVVAVVLRAAAAFYHGNTVEVLPGIHDQISYHALAQRVIDGYGFSFAEMHWPLTRPGEPTAHWSFLYTLYLAAVYVVCGVTPLAAAAAGGDCRGVASVVGLSAGAAHLWASDRFVGSSHYGRLSLLYLLCRRVMTETFYIIGILWCLDLALFIGQSEIGGARRDWLLLGLALGVTLLLRQVFMLFAPFLFMWLLWQIKPRGCGHGGRF
ncbi:MAG: hypothetical protein R2911_30945 [Caldilineaceae bacterium]